MNILRSVREWFGDPFGKKKLDQKHGEIQREIQVLKGQVEQQTRDLSEHPYRTLHKDFRQTRKTADAHSPK